MVRAVNQLHPDVDHREAGHNAALQRLLDALVHSRDEFLGNGATHGLVLELVALAGLVRLHRDVHVAVLAATTRLADEATLDLLDPLADGLAVRHLGGTHVGIHAELAHKAIDDDLKVQLAHSGDDRLTGLLVGTHAEGRVLVLEALQCG